MARKKKTATVTAPSPPMEVTGPRIRRIFAVRESDADRDLLLGLIDQTYRQWKELPGVLAALELGLRPYLAPNEVDGAVLFTQPGHRAVTFVRDGTLFLIWSGSAATEDDAGNNAFVDYLTDLVESLQPEDLYASTFSRLVRSLNVQGKLRAKLVGAGTKVWAGSQVFDMATSHGQTSWDIFALVYSMERNQIERRLVLGQVFAAKKGVWLPAGVHLPGYEVQESSSGKRLVLSSDEAEVDRTRDMIRVLASRGVARAKIEQLTKLGIQRTVNDSGGVRRRSIGEAACPSETIRTLNSWRALYRDGVYIYRREIPNVDLVDQLAGFPIQQGEDGRFVEVPIPVELPEGGWASAAVFEAWDIEAQRRPTNPGGSSQSRIKPLTGLCMYRHGDHEYALLSDGRDSYVFRKRPHDPDRRFPGWDSSKARSTMVAQFDSARLHRSLAEEIRIALTSGADVELIDAEIALRDDGRAHVVFVDAGTRRQHLLAQVDETVAEMARASKLAAKARSPELADLYHEQAEESAQRIATLTELVERADEAPEMPSTLVVHW